MQFNWNLSLYFVGLLPLARWIIRGDGQYTGRAAVHTAIDQKGSIEYWIDFNHAGWARWRRLEIRTLEVWPRSTLSLRMRNTMKGFTLNWIFPQAILHGIEWIGRSSSVPLRAKHMHTDDSHRTMDILVCRPQNTKGMSGHWLHASHTGRSGLFVEQLQILPKQVFDHSMDTLSTDRMVDSFDFFRRISIKETSVGKLGSVCRRVYRIFSHAYFHHRRVFDEFEAETFLCHRFTHFVTKYTLMSKENLIVPIEGATDTGAVPGESEA